MTLEEKNSDAPQPEDALSKRAEELFEEINSILDHSDQLIKRLRKLIAG